MYPGGKPYTNLLVKTKQTPIWFDKNLSKHWFPAGFLDQFLHWPAWKTIEAELLSVLLHMIPNANCYEF